MSYFYYSKFIGINNNFYYVEFKYLIIYSSIGILKIRHSSLNSLVIMNDFFYRLLRERALNTLFNSFFTLITNGHIQKYRLIGVGNRQINYYGDLFKFRLRYSNTIFTFLPLPILTYFKHKRRKFYSLFGLERQLVNKYVLLLTSFKRANIFTKKGFFQKNKLVQFKKRKKRNA